MQQAVTQNIVTIAAVVAGMLITRFLPFVLFPDGKKLPQSVVYLGKVLPPAMMGFLVVYGLKGASVVSAPHGIPELAAVLLTVLLHRWKSSVLLSIGGGTLAYMILLQTLFAK